MDAERWQGKVQYKQWTRLTGCSQETPRGKQGPEQSLLGLEQA